MPSPAEIHAMLTESERRDLVFVCARSNTRSRAKAPRLRALIHHGLIDFIGDDVVPSGLGRAVALECVHWAAATGRDFDRLVTRDAAIWLVQALAPWIAERIAREKRANA